jgi:argininosuccinate lyase
MLTDTGRVREPLAAEARAVLFPDLTDAAFVDELAFYVQIDRAHVVMLAERGVIPIARARLLLATLHDVMAQSFAPLRGRPAPRGAYLSYEQWLIETLGEEAGGAVHIGRSRNDINATVLRLRMRAVYRRLAAEVLRLVSRLIRRAEEHATLTMPVYTHFQAALPVTYGHYLAGVALALMRDMRSIQDAVLDMDRCPLGAGAAGGTSLPIDCTRTAQLLGFTDAVLHSIDAVASRDFVLRLLAAGSVLGVTLSRLAADFQLWSTAEFAFIQFPDSLVGSSSMMPQKRNAFLLEHVKGRSGSCLGAFTSASIAMHATPFSNSIAVGTEGVRHAWSALADLADAVLFARLVVAGASPQRGQMHRRAVEGFTAATELANQLVVRGGLSFRPAHFRVGEALNAAHGQAEPLRVAAAILQRAHGLPADDAWLDPALVAARATRGGGPGQTSVRRIVRELRARWTEAADEERRRVGRWRAGRRLLAQAVAGMLAP